MWQLLFDILFPPTPSEQKVRALTRLTLDPKQVHTASGRKVLTCTRYQDKHVREAIALLKKQGCIHVTNLFAELLSEILIEEYADAAIWSVHTPLIIPVPLAHVRERERGFNQVNRVCAELPESLRVYVAFDILKRVKHTKSQKEFSRAKRLENVEGAFTVRATDRVHNRHVFLIDDVVTTGATLHAAARALERAGASVHAVALARV